MRTIYSKSNERSYVFTINNSNINMFILIRSLYHLINVFYYAINVIFNVINISYNVIYVLDILINVLYKVTKREKVKSGR